MSEASTATDVAEERTTIRSGPKFEHRLDASEVGKFLIELGEQLSDGWELTLVGEGWQLPFAFGEPVELEIDFDGVGDPKLKLSDPTDEQAPAVE